MQAAQFDVGRFQGGRLPITVNDEMAHQLCDVLEAALEKGITLPPAVYSMGEKLCHRVDPEAWFGVKPDAKKTA